jgi:hypothetical protein
VLLNLQQNQYTMIYKFRMISGDDTLFLKEYEFNADETFLDFHNFIQEDLEYDPFQLASFFLTDEQWNKGLELTLIDMENDAGLAAIPMNSVKICDLIKEKKDRLLYVFDIFSDRCFFIELSNIIEPLVDANYPRCTASVGEPPEQLIIEEISIDDIFSEEGEFDEITNDIGSFEDEDLSDFSTFDDSYTDNDY